MKRIAILLLIIAATAVALPQRIAAQDRQSMAGMLARCTFSWGVQMGGSIDMSGQNMSSLDLSGVVGLRYKWIKMLGVGMGAQMMVSNSCRAYPMFFTFRTDFSSTRRRLVFLDTRIGAANNTFPGGVHRTGLYTYGGVGINLATGKRFASFMTLGYTYLHRGEVTYGEGETHFLPHLHYASVGLGIHF
ncbi:MAG: hypothetical protein K2L21_10465 [Muribaculaceae bacterium]|nr:hypothetical protein [Muribaculaceae bacterium]